MIAFPSPVTIGTSPLGRGTTPGSSAEAEAVELALAMLTAGHAYVDTSNNYSDGRSEAVLGIALSHLGDHRSTQVITKVDVDPVSGRFDRDRVLRSFDESLERLGVDRVPLVHLHDPDMVSMSHALGPGGAVEGLLELRESGRVDAIGVAGGPIPMVSAYASSGAFDAVLCHNRYTLVDRSAEPLFEDAHQRGMTVFNAAPFGAGILATGARPDARYAYMPASAELGAWVSSVEGVCRRHGISLPAAALAFSVRSPLVHSTVVGVSSPGRLTELARVLEQEIPEEFWEEFARLDPAPSPIVDPPAP
jgi:D-threo-aldose 1-dehydrogenase